MPLKASRNSMKQFDLPMIEFDDVAKCDNRASNYDERNRIHLREQMNALDSEVSGCS